MPEYSRAEYWDERYKANDTTFDWFVPFEPLRPTLLSLINPGDSVLVVGCGNSCLSAGLYDAGVRNITNIDISEVVIQQMKRRYGDKSDMKWVKMDARRLEFTDNLFDVVIDKGTVDSLLCGSNSFENVYAMNRQVARVLKKKGKYIVITYGQPETRLDHYRRRKLHFEVEHRVVDKPAFASHTNPSASFHVYVITKVLDLGEDDKDDDDDEEANDFFDKIQASLS